MQQTEKYKLNLIEKTDPFAPEALNENTQKVEKVLAGEETARTAADAALDARVTVLETHKLVVGSYSPDSTRNVTVNLGFTPLAVFICPVMSGSSGFILQGANGTAVRIEENGFFCWGALADPGAMTYFYFAIG